MRIVNGHKGCYLFETRLKGQAAHSSQPHRGGNAILAAGRLIAFLAEMAAQKRLEAPGGSPFDPPYTTFNLGQIEGGKAINIVARSEEHTSELQSLMRSSYAVFCLKKKKKEQHKNTEDTSITNILTTHYTQRTY